MNTSIMRWTRWVVLVVGAAALGQAQVFRPEAVSGAVLGGLAGAVIGHNDGRHGREGAVIGAVAGALVGNTIGAEREARGWRGTQAHTPSHRDHGYHGRSGYYGRSGHGGWERHHRAPYAVRHDRWGHRPAWDARANGVFWGGLAGGVIGHNNGRRGWEGAAYGAGAGLILGSWHDRAERRERAERAEARAWAEERAVAAQTVATPAAAPVTIINNHYYGTTASSPMGQANGLFGR